MIIFFLSLSVSCFPLRGTEGTSKVYFINNKHFSYSQHRKGEELASALTSHLAPLHSPLIITAMPKAYTVRFQFEGHSVRFPVYVAAHQFL
uniref:Lipoprotein n=1 Tax=Rhipicephalus zambeziensis TaxID=60191 RepID=A0A224YEP8_9ACAR